MYALNLKYKNLEKSLKPKGQEKMTIWKINTRWIKNQISRGKYIYEYTCIILI